jgi:hypothetical protein
VALVVAVAGVGAVTRRRPFSLPRRYGYRLVGTPAELALDLGVPEGEILAVTASLPAWGHNASLEEVWSVGAVQRALGWAEPPRHRGAPQFRVTIPGARGRRKPASARESAPEGTSMPEGSGDPENGLSASGWPLGEHGEG